ncbi:ABC transporter permease [Nereida sp. MMG025]|uniref:ABC transporter permease n=1 Tax=Nereida sp. MMG025 TaxID=2909981 RepID=UPI001F406673|nr:ABC transporter permease [Nereida sp. MMG025]MCF6444560.1 ABC transporter permease [Nereida sp. MMG025]
MFQFEAKPAGRRRAVGMLELIYYGIVRDVRKSHGNALIGLFMNVMQTIIFVAAFYFMFSILGIRGSALRGDFLLYIMTGIFLFLTHTKALSAVVGSEGPASPMMKHAPMNTAIAICSSALGSLYIQILSLFIVLFLYHVIMTPVHIEDPIGAMAMLLLSWFSGVAIGMVLLALKPWMPGAVQMITQIYSRANMIASGKMFVANTLPSFMLAMFDWNPLFHCIDQARGYTFINYNPRYSNWEYAMIVAIIFLMVGLMGEFYTRKNASVSWSARR